MPVPKVAPPTGWIQKYVFLSQYGRNTWKTNKNTFPNLLQRWDKAKYHFKNISIQRSTTLRKIDCNEHRELEIKAQKLQNNITNGTDDDTKIYPKAKTELQQLQEKDLDALKIRTQIKYAEEGKKSTHYFYSLEQRNQIQETINVFTIDNLDTINEQSDIINETHKFSMENNKSPGLDGLSKNFYKHFWNILGHKSTNILNFAYKNESLALASYL